MKKTNVKRALKTLAKGNNRIMFEQLENKRYMLSDGRIIVTVSETDFNEHKELFKELCETALSRIALKEASARTKSVRVTTVSIQIGEHTARVVKADNCLGAVNEMFLDVFYDLGLNFYFETREEQTDKIKCPLFQSMVVNGKVENFNAILPINVDVKGCLESILDI